MARLTRKQLFALLGRESAIALMSEWGGHAIPTWTEDAAIRLVRDDEIRAELDAGADYRSVARGRGLALGTVGEIANGRERRDCLSKGRPT